MGTIIREAPFGVFLAMVAVPLAMAAAAVIAGWFAKRQATLVKTTKTTPIGMAEDGYRQFSGTVEAVDGQTVTAPLTGSPCCWYTAKVERWTRRNAQGPQRFEWQTMKSVTSSAPMLLRDSTGDCMVHVYGAEVTPTDKSQWTGATPEPADRHPPRLGPSQSTHGVLQVCGGPDSQFRYTEQRIYAGDPMFVLGMYSSHRFDADNDLDGSPPEPAPDGSGIATKRVAAAVDADRPDDGPDPDPWVAADRERHDTLVDMLRAITKAEIEQGGRGRPLVISTTSQADHAYMAEMGSQAAFIIALVPLGIAALVLMARFG